MWRSNPINNMTALMNWLIDNMVMATKAKSNKSLFGL